jgi:hypothetical protein
MTTQQPAPHRSSLETLRQGSWASVGTSRVGVMTVTEDQAVLFVESAQDAGAVHQLRLTVHSGDIVPIEGSFYRIASVHHAHPASSEPAMPGSSRDDVVIDTQPVRLSSIQLQSNGVAIPLGATATLAGYDLEVVELAAPPAGAPPVAVMEVWPTELAKPQTEPGMIKRYSIKAGETIAAGSRQLRVLSIVPPKLQPGLQAFVEVGL